VQWGLPRPIGIRYYSSEYSLRSGSEAVISEIVFVCLNLQDRKLSCSIAERVYPFLRITLVATPSAVRARASEIVMKNIILLSDGTGNAASKIWRTNVWRTFESIDLSQPDQVALYADGVGTSRFKPLAIFGGMFGYGLRNNVIECYKFVCRNYQPDDRIYGFGFSRGAYTIRVAMKVVVTQGLVKYDNNEVDLHRYAVAAYRAFRRDHVESIWHIRLFRRIRDLLLRTPYEKLEKRKVAAPKIRFLGLWDTVAAYGLPFEEMTRFYSKWIFPFEILDANMHENVLRACHALSVDDERTTFHPVLWTEVKRDGSSVNEPASYTSEERLSQVWFAGVHANVGGGYPDDSLAHVSLGWILKEASLCGLRFKEAPKAEPDAIRFARSASDKDGRLYDSRRGLASYYRYGPRNIFELCNCIDTEAPARSVRIPLPKIHYSVFERIKAGAHPYAPISLPSQYAVVAEDGKILTGPNIPYEKSEQAKLRFKHQDQIWDAVWRRRLAYFGTILASAFLVAYPLFHRSPSFAEYTSYLRPASDLIRLVGSFIPTEFANFWIDEYARDPSWFLLGVAALVFFISLNSRMGTGIADDMRAIWKLSFSERLVEPVGKTWAYSIRTNPVYLWLHKALQTNLLPAASAVALGYLLIALASHLSFNFYDAAGFVCREATDPNQLTRMDPGQTIEREFNTSNLCQSMKVLLERDRQYTIQFDSTASFRDGLFGINASRGFSSSDVPNWYDRALLTLAVPLRREWIRPWFRVVARFGGSGGEETFLDPDFTDAHWIDERIRATRDGELFLFVNYPVIGIPGLFGFFYQDNSGTAKVKIARRS